MRSVVIIHGAFPGKKRVYYHVVAVAPAHMTLEEILQEGLKQEAFESIPSHYEAYTCPSRTCYSEGLSPNAILLVIPVTP